MVGWGGSAVVEEFGDGPFLLDADSASSMRQENRNLATLFTVSVLIGMGAAVYEVVLPLFLKQARLLTAALAPLPPSRAPCLPA